MVDLLWQSKAECAKSEDIDIWFSERNEKEAKDICWNKCPVRVQCLAYAQQVEFGYGVFGGYSPKERWQLRRALIQGRQAQAADLLIGS